MKAILNSLMMIIILVSCDNITDSTNNYLDFQNYFPLKIGNKWTYKYENLLKAYYEKYEATSNWKVIESLNNSTYIISDIKSDRIKIRTDEYYNPIDTIFLGLDTLHYRIEDRSDSVFFYYAFPDFSRSSLAFGFSKELNYTSSIGDSLTLMSDWFPSDEPYDIKVYCDYPNTARVILEKNIGILYKANKRANNTSALIEYSLVDYNINN